MFNSTGNNFGAGQITFKDYQASNYVVLNSKFTFDPTNADYQACDQLEIYVPDLTIDRSAVGGVFIRFVEDYHYSWGDSVYDGGTVLKSGSRTRTPSSSRISPGSTRTARSSSTSSRSTRS